jgi:hypothetical protein
VGVVMIEEAIDGGLEVGDGSEDAALETALGQGGEKALDGVEPGSRGWGEVEGPAGMASEPFPRAAACLWAAWLSRIAWIVLPAGTSRSTALRKRMNS